MQWTHICVINPRKIWYHLDSNMKNPPRGDLRRLYTMTAKHCSSTQNFPGKTVIGFG